MQTLQFQIGFLWNFFDVLGVFALAFVVILVAKAIINIQMKRSKNEEKLEEL